MIEQLWLILLGFAAGVLGSMVGLGGGIIVVPVLIFSGFHPLVASTHGLFVALSNAVASTIMYSRQGSVDFAWGIKLGLASIPGSVLGAVVSSEVSPGITKVLFGIVLISAVVYMLLKKRLAGKDTSVSTLGMIIATSVSFFGGIILAFFGVGGGIVFVPLLISAMAMMMKKAVATSLLILLFASLSGVIIHTMLGHSDFLQAGLLAIGAFFGGTVGAQLTRKINEKFLQILIAAALIAAAMKMFLNYIQVDLSMSE